MAVKIDQYIAKNQPDRVGGAPQARGQVVVGVGNAVANLGTGIAQVGNAMADSQAAKTYLDNRKAVEDAQRAMDRARFDTTEWVVNAQMESDADPRGFVERTKQMLEVQRNVLVKNHSNPEARRLIDQKMSDLTTSVLGQSLQWQAQKTVEYRQQQVANSGEVWSKTVGLDPSQYDTAIAELDERVKSLPGTMQEKARDGLRKSLRTAAAYGSAARNPVQMQRLVDDSLGIKPAPKETAAPAIHAAVGTTTLGSRMLKQESGGKHLDANGELITNPKSGARGIAQIIQATGKDPGYGVAPLRDDSEAEHLRFFNDYLNAMLKEFGNDEQKAAAAYNAGPGRVAGAIKRGGSNWLALMPDETRQYVAAVAPVANRMALSADALQVASAHGPMETAAMITANPILPPAPSSENFPQQTGVPYIDAMSIEERLALKNHVDAEVRRGQNEEQARIRVEEHDAAAMAQDGKVAPAPSLQRFQQAYGPAVGQEHYTRAVEIRQMGARIGAMATWSPTQAMEHFDKPVDAGAPGDYAQRTHARDIEMRAWTTIVSERAKDAMSAAHTQKLGHLNPINVNEPAAMMAELTARESIATLMKDTYQSGTGTVLTRPEQAQLASLFDSSPPEAQTALLASMKQALPNEAVFRATVQSFRPDSPVTQLAANIVALGAPMVSKARWALKNPLTGKTLYDAEGNDRFTIGEDKIFDPAAEATKLLWGEQLLNPSKGQKKEDGKPRVAMPKDSDLRAVWADHVGDVYRNNPQLEQDAYQAYRAYYAAEIAQRGDSSGALNPKAQEAALQVVAGGVEQHGEHRIMRPLGMSTGMFNDELAREFNDKMMQAGLSGQYTLGTVELENVAEGVYRMYSGTRVVKGDNGRPVYLTVDRNNMRMRAPRVEVPQ
jgi:hypothetical protein